MPTNQTYKLEDGIKRMLKLGIEHELTATLQAMSNEVDVGEISEATRTIFVALGWITWRDPRVKAKSGTPGSAPRRARTSPGQAKVEEAQDEPTPRPLASRPMAISDADV